MTREDRPTMERHEMLGATVYGEPPAPDPPGPRESGLPATELFAERYRIECMLGAGGMGTVYRVRDTFLDEVIALKTLRASLGHGEGARMFKEEVRLSRRVTHPNVARVYDLGRHAGQYFLTMEYLDGESLATRIERYGAMDANVAIGIVVALCDGLAVAHAAGVVHRDLKPDNVIVTREGRVAITDFGVAFASRRRGVGDASAQVVGTPAYMAPEQVEGAADIDERADVFALGVMLYELVTGELPWGDRDPISLLAARVAAVPPTLELDLPWLPTELGEVIRRCTALPRRERFGSAVALASALQALRSRSILPPPSAPAPAMTRPGGREKTVAVLPLANRGVPEDDYLALAVTETLIDLLAGSPGLKVRPLGAVRAMGGDADPQAAGRALGVQVVIAGSAQRRRDGAVQVALRAHGVDDGFVLTAGQFESPIGALLDRVRGAAASIADTLATSVQAQGEGPADPVALELYLRARHAYQRFPNDDLAEAAALYEQALARCPNDPTILAAAALLALRRFFSGEVDLPATASMIGHASQVAPGHPGVRLAIATLAWQTDDPVRAVQTLVEVVRAAPRLVEARWLLGRIRLEAGDVDGGLATLRQVVADDPSLHLAMRDLCRVHAYRGDWDTIDALMAHKDAPERWYELARRATTEWNPEVAARCIATMPGFLVLGGPQRMALECVITGQRPAIGPLGAALPAAGVSPRRRQFHWQISAQLFAGLRDFEASMDAIERAVDAGFTDLFWMDEFPLLAPLRSTARFAAARAQVEARAAELRRHLG